MSLVSLLVGLSLHVQLVVSALGGMLCIVPFVALPIWLLVIAVRTRSQLYRNLFASAFVLLFAGINSASFGLEQIICRWSDSAAAVQADMHGFVPMCYHNSAREVATQFFNACAAVAHVVITISWHAEWHKNGMLYFPPLLQWATIAAAVACFGACAYAMFTTVVLDLDTEHPLVSLTFTLYSLINLYLMSSALRSVWMTKTTLVQFHYHARRSRAADIAEPQRRFSMARRLSASFQDALSLKRGRRLAVVIVCDQMVFVTYTLITQLETSAPAGTLPWLVVCELLPTFLLQCHFVLSTLYIILLREFVDERVEEMPSLNTIVLAKPLAANPTTSPKASVFRSASLRSPSFNTVSHPSPLSTPHHSGTEA
ncbi:hypothetical protein RI367_003068 [Sorochytrium milnesiophthora]